MYELFERYADAIRSLDETRGRLPSSLLLHQDRKLRLRTYYAPFDFLNRDAQLAIVGVTPGPTQAAAALAAAKRALAQGASTASALRAAKATASFAGLRPEIASMLDHIGLNGLLGIGSCSQLFDARLRHALHTTSIIRYPTFRDTTPYNRTPTLASSGYLKGLLYKYFLPEIEELRPTVIYVPLGATANQGLEVAIERKVVERRLVLQIPHPSGANRERVSYFLDRKARRNLSRQTDPDKIDKLRRTLRGKVKALRRDHAEGAFRLSAP